MFNKTKTKDTIYPKIDPARRVMGLIADYLSASNISSVFTEYKPADELCLEWEFDGIFQTFSYWRDVKVFYFTAYRDGEKIKSERFADDAYFDSNLAKVTWFLYSTNQIQIDQ
jgi:hypothetical protein